MDQPHPQPAQRRLRPHRIADKHQERPKPRQGRIRATRPPRTVPDRRTALSKALAFWPHELDDESPPARRRIVARLRRALRAERQRGIAGHWTYDLARHIELLRLYRTELAALPAHLASGPRHADAVSGDCR